MTTISTWLAHSLYTRLKRELTTISAGLAQNQKPTAKTWIDHDFCGISTLVCERTAKMWIDYDHLMIIVLYHFKSWQIVNFPFISNNFSAVPAYHNSYVILGIVPSILIFWNEFCCLHKKLPKQTYVASCLKSALQTFNRRTGWLLRNIHFSSGNGSFPSYVDVFFFISPTRRLLDFTMSNTAGVL